MRKLKVGGGSTCDLGDLTNFRNKLKLEIVATYSVFAETPDD